jgi:hypothetical protein
VSAGAVSVSGATLNGHSHSSVVVERHCGMFVSRRQLARLLVCPGHCGQLLVHYNGSSLWLKVVHCDELWSTSTTSKAGRCVQTTNNNGMGHNALCHRGGARAKSFGLQALVVDSVIFYCVLGRPSRPSVCVAGNEDRPSGGAFRPLWAVARHDSGLCL